MHRDYQEIVHKIAYLTSDLDSIYHLAARKLGVSDSVLIVAYMIHEKGDGCLLYDIWKESGISKQTINSAIRKLEEDGILRLEQDKGKSKRVYLTEKGKTFVDETATRLLEAECRAFEGWTDEEFEIHLRLMERYNRAFRAQIEAMEERSE